MGLKEQIVSVLLCCSFIALETSATPLLEIPSAQHQPQTKQGILEIPKNIATILRNVIDRNLQNYLNLTTPKPNPDKPDAVEGSIIGHYLLNNFIISPVPASAYQEKAKEPAKPIFVSNSPTYSKDHIIQETTFKPVFTTNEISFSKGSSAAAVPQEPTTFKPLFISNSNTYSKKPATVAPTNPPPPPVTQRATPAPEKVHTLDVSPGLYGSYGPDDVYYISPTRESVVFPLETSSQKLEQETTAFPIEDVPTTEEVGDEDEDVNVNELFLNFKRRQEEIDVSRLG